MNKILHYEVEITDNTGIIKDKNFFRCTELNVIGENDTNIVVDNSHFQTLRKEHDKYSTCVGKESIFLCSNDSCWGNRISYSLYTFTKKRASTIRKEITAAVNKKYGFYLNGINLDIVKD